MQQAVSTRGVIEFHTLADLIIAALEDAGASAGDRKMALAQARFEIAAAWQRRHQLVDQDRDYERSIDFARNDAECLFRGEGELQHNAAPLEVTKDVL
jgi:hypothetical protein